MVTSVLVKSVPASISTQHLQPQQNCPFDARNAAPERKRSLVWCDRVMLAAVIWALARPRHDRMRMRRRGGNSKCCSTDNHDGDDSVAAPTIMLLSCKRVKCTLVHPPSAPKVSLIQYLVLWILAFSRPDDLHIAKFMLKI
jgi:hypothetical protein